jgi:hypothetical protein
MKIREIWRKVTATRYVRALEADVARLRAENRAMLNSILGIAGVPPIPVQAAEVEGVREPSHPTNSKETVAKGSATPNARVGVQAGSAQIAAPLRRRSWQQINRMLEFESAKKEKPGHTEGTGAVVVRP